MNEKNTPPEFLIPKTAKVAAKNTSKAVAKATGKEVVQEVCRPDAPI